MSTAEADQIEDLAAKLHATRNELGDAKAREYMHLRDSAPYRLAMIALGEVVGLLSDSETADELRTAILAGQLDSRYLIFLRERLNEILEGDKP